jgi:riboflavin kinase / FMN adenylyltransferase
MEIYHAIADVKNRPAVVLAVGAFDGIHQGHRAIIARVREEARKRGVKSMLMTFSPTPREILGDEKEVALMKADEKIERIRELQIDILCIREFDRSFAAISRNGFIESLLTYLDLQALVAGPDHHIGKGHEGGITFLKKMSEQYGFELLLVPKTRYAGAEVSSQRIRRCLKEGKIRDVNAMLAYAYRISGTVIPGRKRGRSMGYPTLNIRPELARCLIPAPGVYCVRLELNGYHYHAVCNIGMRPTFNETELSMEVHAIGVDLKHQYGKPVKIYFEHFIRQERKFDNEDALRVQIGKDIETCKKILTEEKCQA